jgi:long-chain acyl-CoA synthetase
MTIDRGANLINLFVNITPNLIFEREKVMVSYRDKPWLQHYDDYVPHSLEPYPDWTVGDILSRAAERAPRTPAMIMSAVLPLFGRVAKTVTYAELVAQADALGAGLLAMGLKKGDRVALLMVNSPAFVVTWFGVLRAGLVAVGLNPTYPPARLRDMLNDSGAKAIVTLSLFYPKIKQIRYETRLEQVIVTNIKEGFTTLASTLFTLFKEKKDGHRVPLESGDHSLPDILQRYASQKPNVSVSKDDFAIFQYTGGTTGPSKAAVSTHSAIVANTLQQAAWLNGSIEAEPGSITLAALPFYHVFGMISVIASVTVLAGTMVLVPNARDIGDLLDIIKTYRPSIFHGVPALYNAVNTHELVAAGKVDLSSINYCLSGSAPLPRPTKERFEELSGASLIEGYGMSEAPTATHCNPLHGENRTGSVGLPLPDTLCRIVSPEDPFEEMAVGDVGEIAISGPHLMQHYHERPTETDNALVTDESGCRWLLTGDLGYMSEDGYFHIVDRKKDMALIGGYNVYPNQVDQVLTAHPAVTEVAVGVIPHPEKVGQEALKAWVVLEAGQQVTEEELMAFASEKLARYEIPSRYEFVEALPRSDVGKILRRELIRRELERSQAD